MLKGKEKKPNKKRANMVFGLTLSIAFVIFAVALYGESRKGRELEASISELAQQSSQEAKRNVELRQRLTWTDNDEYVEKIARERLKMVRPDEIIYIDKNK